MTQQQLTLEEFATRGTNAQVEVDKLCQQPYAHAKDPQTSFDAGQKMVDSGALARQQRCVWECIKRINFEDFTALELAEGVKNEWYYTIQRRLHELSQIKRTDEKRDGHYVWRLLERRKLCHE